MNSKKDPTARFSDRVENYVRYRPGYPRELAETLERDCDLTPDCDIADIGSGTGILTELFIRNGNVVYAVEPNADMRAAAEQRLGRHAQFRSVEGRAEETSLEPRSVDFVVAGQAFHWFDREAAQREFRRILHPPGWVVLAWNDRDTTSTPFLRDYEALLHRFGTDYAEVDHRRINDEVLSSFYGPGGYREAAFRHQQALDFEGLRGRLLSSSYVPGKAEPGHAPMLTTLREIYERHASPDGVALEYVTRVFYGTLG